MPGVILNISLDVSLLIFTAALRDGVCYYFLNLSFTEEEEATQRLMRGLSLYPGPSRASLWALWCAEPASERLESSAVLRPHWEPPLVLEVGHTGPRKH